MPSLDQKLLGKVGRNEKVNEAGGHVSILPSQSSRVALQAGESRVDGPVPTLSPARLVGVSRADCPISTSPLQTSSRPALQAGKSPETSNGNPQSLPSPAVDPAGSSTPLQSTPDTATGTETGDLWERAEHTLSKDKGKKDLLQAYLEILESELGAKLESRGTAHRQEHLNKLLDAKTRELEEKKSKLRIGDDDVDVKHLLAKVSKIVLFAKEIISTAASAHPASAIACAGATVIFTLFIQAVDQHTILVNGLNYTSGLICSFPVFENYRSMANVPSLRLESASQLAARFEEDLVALYSKVLEFQARSLCYLRKYQVTQLCKDMFKQDGWESLVKDMKESEGSIRRFKEDIDGEKLHAGFDGLQASARIEKVNKCLQMLDTCPYEVRKDRNNERMPGTCDWFTDHSRFTNWNKSKTSSLLWVSADPGCGKSVLARYLVDKVLPSTSNRTTCYFFFKDDFDDQRSAANAICALLRQLFKRKPHLLRDSILKNIDTDGSKWVESIDGLWSILISVAADQDAGDIVCILDALDQCRDADRSRLIKAITKFYVADPEKLSLKFILTSRPCERIRREFWEVLDRLPTIYLGGEDEAEVEKISREIDLVIKSRVNEIGKKKSLEPEERIFLQDRLTRIPNRTYIWVELTLDIIETISGFTKGNVRRSISEIPETVDEAYNNILDRNLDPQKAKRLLHIVAAATRPLSLKEMSLALVIQESHKSYDDIEQEQESEARFGTTVRDLCGLFITIIDSKIYLRHQTAREFLVPNESLASSKDPSRPADSRNRLLKWKHSLQPADSNRVIAEICIWYLNFYVLESRLAVFLDYAAKNWAAHIHDAGIGREEAIAASVLSICETEKEPYNTWSPIYASYVFGFPESASSLIIASYFGLEAVVKLLLARNGIDPDSKDSKYGQTPLSWAVAKGHEAVVKLLLEKGVELESKDSKHSQTPLSWAAVKGHETVVKLLLEKDAELESKNGKYGQTPLSWAAAKGHEAVVKLLLKKGAKLESKDSKYSQTPLSWAAEKGHEAVVKLLLKKGAELESKDGKYGQTPLSWAAEKGHETVVKLLLKKGAELESKSRYGRTPLSWAAEKGHETVVKLLLEKGAELESKDGYGRMPLSWAAENGYSAVVKLLLEKGAELESENDYGRTALSWAAANGHESVVKLLLEKGAELGSENGYYRTPLSWAVENEHEAVVKLLLEKGAELESKNDRYGRTLLWAAENGHEMVVKLLLEKDAELESKNGRYGRTPLLSAAEKGHEAVVKLLLEKGAKLESKISEYSQTPLSLAAENGHETVVKLLLEKGAELESKNRKYGLTPLSWAAVNRHEAVVKLLLEKGAELESENGEYAQTPLSLAAEKGYEAMVRLLLEKGAELESKKKEYSLTPLSWAAGRGHEAVVKLLLEKGAELKYKDGGWGQTPLSSAAASGYETVVKLLLEKGAELESKDDRYGQTPLSSAAAGGHEMVVKLLLEKGAELESKDDRYGQTPLSWAATNRSKTVIKLLLKKGAELESKDSKYGRTPLSWAAENGHKAGVKLLLKKGAELESKDGKYGQTPLSLAAAKGYEAVVEVLLEKSAELESKDDKYGHTPLSWAAANGHETVVKLLLEKGAELESKDDKYGRTPLSWAAANGYEAVVKLLLEKGAELESKDGKYGQTPLSWAAEKGHKAVVKLLLKKGADLESKDSKYAQTPLLWAVANEHEAVVKLLLEKGAGKSQ